MRGPSALAALGLLLATGCPQPAPLDDAPCTFDGETPAGVALTVSVHYRGFDTGTADAYEQVSTEVDWVADWAARHDLVLELALNGYQAEAALAAGETARFSALAEAGHGFGVHHHPTVRVDPLVWADLGTEPLDVELQQSVDDHRDWVGQALDPLGIEYPGGHARLTGRGDWWAGMMTDSGYTTETVEQWAWAATGGELGADHDVLHPFRWAPCDPCPELISDPAVPFVAVPQHPQVGKVASGEHLDFDGTVPHLRTTLVLAYLEWRAEVLSGDAPRVWATGVTIHPEQGAGQNEDLDRLGAFLVENFLAPTEGGVGRSVCPVSREELRGWHETWEAAHPGEAAFELRSSGDYPYRLPQLRQVYDHHLVARHLDEAHRGVHIVELQRVEPVDDGFEPRETVLLVWADLDDGTVSVDLQDWLHGPVRITDSTGSEESSGAGAVKVGAEPLVVEES